MRGTYQNPPDKEIAAIPVPPGWAELDATFDGATLGGRHFAAANGLLAILSCDEISGKKWLHLSVSRRSRTPTYEDLVWARDGFLGRDEPAYQVFPKSTEHRNLHNYCLHLWRCLDGDPFPDPIGERSGTIG